MRMVVEKDSRRGEWKVESVFSASSAPVQKS